MSIFNIEFSKNRIYGLDFLRALSVFFVVYGHGNIIFDEILGHSFSRKLIELPVFDGVTIFFVLSGFLIGGILIKEIEEKGAGFNILLNFWKRRWFRTLPNYFFILFLIYLASGMPSFHGDWKYLFFLQNFNSPQPYFFGESWSLSVEEWFYLTIPALFFISVKLGLKPKKSLLIWCVTIIILCILMRYYKYYFFNIKALPAWDIHLRKQVLTRVDSVVYGILGAYINYYHKDAWLKNKKIFLFSGIFLLILHKALFLIKGYYKLELNSFFCVYSFPLASIGSLMLIPFLSSYRKKTGVFYKIITKVSIISYSMYLINLSLIMGIIIPKCLEFYPVNFTGFYLCFYKYFLFWSFTIIGSVLLYKFFESPLTKLRDINFSSIFNIKNRITN